jgi:chromosomal replication initiator protein
MKAWEDLLSKMEVKLGHQAVTQWLKPIRVVRFDAGNIHLEANAFQRSWFEEHARPYDQTAFLNNNQRPVKIHFEANVVNTAVSNSSSEFQIAPDFIDSLFTIENFIVSDANRMTFHVVKEITLKDQCSYNPIFISGPQGSGKTHLLMGLAQSLIAAGQKVFYVNVETFTGHVVQAIRLGRMGEFRQKYRAIDALIIDDIHRLARRSATQEEFFHTFNALHTMQIPIIISSSEPAGQLVDIEPRLISRFEWGIPLRLEPPDSMMLKQILINHARALELNVPSELIDFLISRFFSKITAPIEALHAIALRCNGNFSISHVEESLKDLLARESRSIMTTEKILEQTSAHFGIRIADLTGTSQLREFTIPRQIAMFLCRSLLHMPFQTIGRLFNRDHSTVMSSVKQIGKAQENDQRPILDPVEAILKKLNRVSN